MVNINFVPDDYVQNGESHKTNLLYLALFVVVMAGLAGSFATIKMRQRALGTKEKLVDAEMAKKKDNIKQLEELQTKRNAMWKTALTTAELLEPVPRSVLLASLTNNLPSGTSLLKLNIMQKKPKKTNQTETSKYKAEQAKMAAAGLKISPEKLLETHIDIEGVAPSDLQVADYIKKLINSSLLDNVVLVESKELKINNVTYRQFKLKTMLGKDIRLAGEDIEKIVCSNNAAK